MDIHATSLLLQNASPKTTALDHGQMRARSPAQKAQELQQATQAFEAIFLNQMMKTARQSSMGSDLLTSHAVEQSQMMLDERRSDALAKNSNFGIARALYNQFAPHAGVPKIKD